MGEQVLTAVVGGVFLAALIGLFCWVAFRIGRNVGHQDAWKVVVNSAGKKLRTPYGTVKVDPVEKVTLSREFGESVHEFVKAELEAMAKQMREGKL